jgi:hypothetical protein
VFSQARASATAASSRGLGLTGQVSSAMASHAASAP